MTLLEKPHVTKERQMDNLIADKGHFSFPLFGLKGFEPTVPRNQRIMPSADLTFRSIPWVYLRDSEERSISG